MTTPRGFTDSFDREASGPAWRWGRENEPPNPELPIIDSAAPATVRCNTCGFSIVVDRNIRFDEMCEHFQPAPGYGYPWSEYFAIREPYPPEVQP